MAAVLGESGKNENLSNERILVTAAPASRLASVRKASLMKAVKYCACTILRERKTNIAFKTGNGATVPAFWSLRNRPPGMENSVVGDDHCWI